MKWEDKYVGFILIGVSLALFLITFCIAYLFLTGVFPITDISEAYTYLPEPIIKILFFGMMILIASLIAGRGIEFYRVGRNDRR